MHSPSAKYRIIALGLGTAGVKVQRCIGQMRKRRKQELKIQGEGWISRSKKGFKKLVFDFHNGLNIEFCKLLREPVSHESFSCISMQRVHSSFR